MRRSRYHRIHLGPAAGPLGVLLLVGFAILAFAALMVALLVVSALMISPMLVAGAVLVIAAAQRRRRWLAGPPRALHQTERPSRDERGDTADAPVPATPGRAGRRGLPRSDWARARERFVTLRGEYAQFECDPMAVLRLPALTDVTVPSTARFVDAFAEAQALDTDTEPPAEHATAYLAAVDRAGRAWQAALEAAERIRLSRIPPQEQAAIRRAIKLLTVAQESGHDAERRAAYAKVRTELSRLDRAGVLRLPPAAGAALEAGSRGQLPPAARGA